MARSMRVACALGVVALFALAACTHEDRRYGPGYYGNGNGYGYDQPYGNGYGPPYGYDQPYGNSYGQPYKSDYCAFHHCPPKEWQI
jgi:hypothetical protein